MNNAPNSDSGMMPLSKRVVKPGAHLLSEVLHGPLAETMATFRLESPAVAEPAKLSEHLHGGRDTDQRMIGRGRGRVNVNELRQRPGYRWRAGTKNDSADLNVNTGLSGRMRRALPGRGFDHGKHFRLAGTRLQCPFPLVSGPPQRRSIPPSQLEHKCKLNTKADRRAV